MNALTPALINARLSSRWVRILLSFVTTTPVSPTHVWKPFDIFNDPTTKMFDVLLTRRAAAVSDSISYELTGPIGVRKKKLG
jgi:hypothetical protein